MKLLFLALFDELAPSSRSRVFQYLPHLKKQGVESTVIIYNSNLGLRLDNLAVRSRPGRAFKKVLRALCNRINHAHQIAAIARLLWWRRSHDIVFIQKAVLNQAVMRILAGGRAPIVFDMDDAIYANNKAYDVEGLGRMLPMLSLAVVENEVTEAYFAANGVKTLRITGPIDCDRYHPRNEDPQAGSETVIGWIGGPSTAAYLRLVEPEILACLEKHPEARYRLIGAGMYHPHPKTDNKNWSLDTEVENLARFDIGIMPLPDDEWSRGKGGYKLLQYMALGIPSIASPVGVNQEIQVQGVTGYLAGDGEDWKRCLEILITDRRARSRMGKEARRRVLETYSYEANTGRLIEALKVVIASAHDGK